VASSLKIGRSFSIAVGSGCLGRVRHAIGGRGTRGSGIRSTPLPGIGFLVAVFKTDPKGVTDLTTAGTLHVLGSMAIFFPLLITAWMVRGVFKRDPIWEPFAKTQLWFAFAYTVTMFGNFGTPEDGPAGLTQRIFVPVMMAWLFTLAWNVRRNSSAIEVT
jgi:hypothetical protein